MSKNKKYINIACVILIIIIVVILFYYIKNNYLGVKSNKSNKINITIFGSSKININKKYFEKSRELITKLNEHKNTINVVYGGGSQGLMGEIALFKGNVISSNITKFTEHSVEDEYVFDNILLFLSR